MSRRKGGSSSWRTESESAVVDRNWQRYQYGKDRGHFEYIEQARLCEDFYLGAGLQWSEMDRAYLDLIGRPALEQNHIFPSMAAVSSVLPSRAGLNAMSTRPCSCRPLAVLTAGKMWFCSRAGRPIRSRYARSSSDHCRPAPR